MRKIYFLIALIIIVIAVLGCWYLFRRRPVVLDKSLVSANTVTTATTSINQNATSHHQLPLELDYTVDAPNGILVTDPSGYQTGINSATGVVYEGIPNSTYDDSGSRVVRIVSPEAGHYTIQVIGGTTGSYYLETGVSDGINIPKSQVATGTIETGNVMAYTQSYDPNNLQSAIVTFQSATSSTVGIIASSSKGLPACAMPPFKVGQKPCPINQ
jgi:hypothetical protein